MVTMPLRDGPDRRSAAALTDGDHAAGSASPLSAATGPAAQGQADGLHRPSGRIPRRAGDNPINHHVAGAKRKAPRA